MLIRTIIGLGTVTIATGLLIFKIWQMRSRWRSPRVWALWALVFFYGAAETFSVPEVAWWLRGHTGVANIARLLTYSSVCTGAGAALTLALVWRYPAREAWTRVRWVLGIYGLVIVLLVALFSLSSVPEERPIDFPTHYADQPTVAAMMAFCIASAMASFSLLAYWCFAWARSEDFADLPWLRWGLYLYGGVALTFSFWLALTMVLAAISAWSGTTALGSVYALASNVLPLVACILLVSALLVPRFPVMRSWAGRWRAFLLLRSLHRTLRPVAPASVIVAQNKRLNPHHRVRRMMIELNDWRTTLSPLFDPEIRQEAEERGREHGLTGEKLAAVVEASQLQAASRDWRRGVSPSAGTPLSEEEGIRDGNGSIDAELDWWIRVAHACKRHPSTTA